MIKRWFSALLPSTLGGQLIALLVLAVVSAQAISLWAFHDERRGALMEVARDNVLARSISLTKLIEDTPDSLHPRILEASSSRSAAFWIGASPVVSEPATKKTELQLQNYVASQFVPAREVRIDLDITRKGPSLARRLTGADGPPEPRQRLLDGLSENQRQALREKRIAAWEKKHPGDKSRPQIDLTLSIRLEDGSWFNMATDYRPVPPSLTPLLVQMALSILAIILIVALAMRRISRPLRELARSAERFGRGEDVPPLPVDGPSEVRALTGAFNEMRDRLTRFVTDRTRMLAAISHDLRTPITSLRLRAEFIEDDENREKIIETLEEMAQMTEATLSFARDEATREETSRADLKDLLESLVRDQSELGHDVSMTGNSAAVFAVCRPMALKRALRNIIENGIRYGGSVSIDLKATTADALIRIRDKGPGIPEERMKDVFEPFVRLEESRSEQTGGIGLGLAIARSIIHAHGGTISLKNHSEGGLEAEIRLPVE
ncbi:ATP-binding protein [Roseibium litorale]|uniref:histidine kinase n=1 Tax=Roseibium litorale TaxID=2803841 RepID=A0ABR9CTQ5_9HYPH|nr:ATP-binding protein [Roseibium litorale]MBD8893999.1 HAMP domain-containing protein [Roseibium litorale]